jgi:hypothetical protein
LRRFGNVERKGENLMVEENEENGVAMDMIKWA